MGVYLKVEDELVPIADLWDDNGGSGSDIVIYNGNDAWYTGWALDAVQGRVLKEWIQGNTARIQTLEKYMPTGDGRADWNETDPTKFSYIKNKPFALSSFENDEGFITKDVDDLTNYYNKTETDNQIKEKTKDFVKKDTKDLEFYYTSEQTDDLIKDKMDRENPVGIGSFSMNRKTDETHGIGRDSTTTGATNIASGEYSSAHGLLNIASGKSSFVFGQMNIEDSSNKYVQIVGNGYVDDNINIHRKNAYTLDWDGNGTYSGGVTAKGDSEFQKNVTVKKDLTVNENITSKTISGESVTADDLFFDVDGTKLNVKVYINDKIEEVLNGIGSVLDTINRKVV